MCIRDSIITGLPDAYGRGRIIGDYRRIALYGIDRLIEDKLAQKDSTGSVMTDDVIRLREEISEQIVALKMMKQMAASYGCDISRPAANVQEAILSLIHISTPLRSCSLSSCLIGTSRLLLIPFYVLPIKIRTHRRILSFTAQI